MLGVVGLQLLDVMGPALPVADTVNEQRNVGQPQGVHQPPGQFNYLGVHRGIGVAQDLHAELVVLAEAARLGALVPENGTEVVHADGLGQVVHPVFKVGAAYGGGTFRAKGYQVASPVLEGVHFLLDDVRPLAHRADE